MTLRKWVGLVAVASVTWLAAPSGQSASEVAFVGANVVDLTGAGAARPATILVRDGRIAAVGAVTLPASARTVSLAGKTVIPGLVSAHSHITDVDGMKPRAYTRENTLRQLALFARYGVTTVLSLGGEQAPAFAARDEQSAASLDRARLFLAGDIVMGATPDAARQMVARVAATRPDMIKIRVDDNLGASTKMAPEVYEAVIQEAHARGLRVAAHIFYLEDAKRLLRAGVDMIAHSVRDRDIDAEFIALMTARDVPYCPTLTRELSVFGYESTPAFFADPFFLREVDPAVVAYLSQPERQAAMRASTTAQAIKAGLVVAERNLKAAADAGVRVVMGTDSGVGPERFQGYFEHRELEMMVAAGMSPVHTLRAATVDAARAIGFDGGALLPGRPADFVVLDRDPLQDIRHTTTISSVWIAGNEVRR